LRFILIFLLLVGFSYGESLLVAVASNVQYPMEEVVSLFKKEHPSVDVKLIVSSSGKLTAQIERGAPYHVFLSADLKYPQYLYKKGLTAGKPRVYAEGVLSSCGV